MATPLEKDYSKTDRMTATKMIMLYVSVGTGQRPSRVSHRWYGTFKFAKKTIQ